MSGEPGVTKNSSGDRNGGTASSQKPDQNQNTFAASETNQPVENTSRNSTNKKEVCDTRVSHTPNINNLYLDRNLLSSFSSMLYDRTKGEFLNFRVRRIVKMKYLSLDPDQRKMVRDILEEVILNMSDQRAESKSIVLNINLNQQVVNVNKSESALKLKREIDRLNRELERALSENIELKRMIEELKSRPGRDAVRMRELERELENYKHYLAVVYACLELNCNLDSVREYVENKISDYYSRNREKAVTTAKSIGRAE